MMEAVRCSEVVPLKVYVSLYLFLAVILTQFSAAYFYSKARTNYRKVFTALTLCISVYLFGYLMIFNSSRLHEAVFWNQVQYFGVPFISVLWLILALFYTNTMHTLNRRVMVLLFFIPATTFLLRLTNAWHHLFYKSWSGEQAFGYFALSMERGAWYYVNISYTTLCLVLAVLVTYYLGYAKHKAVHTRLRFLIFLFASLLPVIGIVTVLIAPWNIDYAALATPVSLIIVTYGVLRYDFLEIKALARETIFENSPSGMVILEPGLRIIDYNKAAEKLFGSIDVPLNAPIKRILQLQPVLRGIFDGETTRELCLNINGDQRFFEIDTAPLGDVGNEHARVLKTIHDVTEKKKVQGELRTLATTDSLSGLYNRGEFIRLALREFDRAGNRGAGFSLLMIDLDRFKTVNDTFGHAAGDAVIREIGRIIGIGFRRTDIAGRLGGDEFAVILKNTSLDQAKTAAKQFLKAVNRERVVYGGREIGVTASVGVAVTSGAEDDSIEDVLKRADHALYEAKAKGRNCVA